MGGGGASKNDNVDPNNAAENAENRAKISSVKPQYARIKQCKYSANNAQFINEQKNKISANNGTKTKLIKHSATLTLLLWLFVFISCLGLCLMYAPQSHKESVFVAEPLADWGGEGKGTEADPYLISNENLLADALYNMNTVAFFDNSHYQSDYYKLTANIELNPAQHMNPNFDYFSSVAFWGNFDGDGHTITFTAENHGLFNTLNAGAVIKNLTIASGTSNTLYYSFANTATGTADQPITITNCVNKANIENGGYNYSGGIINDASDVNISKCANLGNITGMDAGGIVGFFTYVTISECYNAGVVQGSIGDSMGMEISSHAFGIGGNTVTNCYNVGQVSSFASSLSGNKSCAYGITYDTATNCYNVGNVTATVKNGTNTTYAVAPSATNCYYAATISPTPTTVSGATQKTADELKTKATFSGWDFSNVWKIDSTLNDGYPVLRVFNPDLPTVESRTITFDATTNAAINNLGGATTATSATVDDGEAFTITTQTATVTKSGWAFVGWSQTPNSTTTITTISNVSQNITLYAVYRRQLTTNFYDTESTTAKQVSAYLYNNNTSISATAPTISDANMVGWSESTTSATTKIANNGTFSMTESTNAKKYYAIKKTTFTITFAPNGGTGSAQTKTINTHKVATGTATPNVISVNVSMPASTTFTKTGYNFVAWAKGSTSGTRYSANANVSLSANATFYAIWAKGTYTTTFKVTFNNIQNSGEIILYILRDDGQGGYAEFYTYYFDGRETTQTMMAELTKGVEYRVLICKPYSWNFSVSGTNITNGVLKNNKYTFTTSSDNGTISISTTGGTPVNNYVFI